MASKLLTYLTDTKERGGGRITNNMAMNQVEEDTDDTAYVKDCKLNIEEKKIKFKIATKGKHRWILAYSLEHQRGRSSIKIRLNKQIALNHKPFNKVMEEWMLQNKNMRTSSLFEVDVTIPWNKRIWEKKTGTSCKENKPVTEQELRTTNLPRSWITRLNFRDEIQTRYRLTKLAAKYTHDNKIEKK